MTISFNRETNFQQFVLENPVLVTWGGRSHFLKANFGYLCPLSSTSTLKKKQKWPFKKSTM